MTIKFAILGLLAEKPMSGFDLVGEFSTERSVIWPAPQNEIYKILSALKTEGLVRIAERGARGRIVYAITPEGRKALTDWLRAPTDYTMRYDPMLKAVFLGQASPAARRAIAKADLAFVRRQLEILRKADAGRRTQASPDRRADARRMVILFYEAMEKWARETAGEEKSSPPRHQAHKGSPRSAAQPRLR
jgi:PadR family transcriptional regulator, regulatory protein AphA